MPDNKQLKKDIAALKKQYKKTTGKDLQPMSLEEMKYHVPFISFIVSTLVKSTEEILDGLSKRMSTLEAAKGGRVKKKSYESVN